MRLQISEVLGITAAGVDLEPGKVVEVIGPNEAGKSSVATCAQAVLSRTANPLDLPVSLTRKAYLRDGNKDGAALISDGDALVTWRPGAAEIEAPPGDALACPEAVGLVDFTSRRDAKERLATLQAILLPPPEEVIGRLRDSLANLLEPTDLAGVLEVVRKRGWKPAEAVYVERMRQSKREWGTVTGKTYGVKVAADWRPPGWRAALDSKTSIEAEAEVTGARDAFAALNRIDAVSEAEREAALEAKGELSDLNEAVKEARDEAEAARIKRSVAQSDFGKASARVNTQRGRMPAQVSKPPVVSCPHCQGALVISGRELRKFNEVDFEAAVALIEEERKGEKAELDRLTLHARACEGAHLATDKEYGAAWAIYQRVKGTLDQTVLAASRATAEVDTELRQQALATAEAEVEERKADVKMVTEAAAATKNHESVIAYQRIVTALGPRGVRAQMVEVRLKAMNRALQVLGETAGWPQVTVTDQGDISYGGRSVPLCSESARWRVQAMMQLTIAAMTKSAAVVLDRADLLDPVNRQGLVKVVGRVTGKLPIAVLLCSTGRTEKDRTAFNRWLVSLDERERASVLSAFRLLDIPEEAKVSPWPQVEIWRGETKGGE